VPPCGRTQAIGERGAGNTEICQKELGFSVVTIAFFFCLDLLICLKSSMQPKIFWKTFHQLPYDTHFTAELIIGLIINSYEGKDFHIRFRNLHAQVALEPILFV